MQVEYSACMHGNIHMRTCYFAYTIGPVLIVSFSRIRKLLIRKLILLIADHYVQFAQTQLLNSQCS